MNIGNKLKEKFLHKKTSCDPYWENERKITSDNIVELSQFKVGDTVTLITPSGGKTMKISCIELFPNIFKHLIIPNVSVDDFKQRFEVNEDVFIFTLIDDNCHKNICFARDLIKGVVEKNKYKKIVRRRLKEQKRASYCLIIVILLVFLSFLLKKLGLNIWNMIPLLVAICLCFPFVSPFHPCESIIKRRKKNLNKKNGCPLAIPGKGESIKCSMSAEELQLLYGKENVKTIEPKEEYEKLFKEDK